jgi:hypothetical protein
MVIWFLRNLATLFQLQRRLWMINMKGFRRRWSWSISRYYSGIRLRGRLTKSTKTLRIASLPNEFQNVFFLRYSRLELPTAMTIKHHELMTERCVKDNGGSEKNGHSRSTIMMSIRVRPTPSNSWKQPHFCGCGNECLDLTGYRQVLGRRQDNVANLFRAMWGRLTQTKKMRPLETALPSFSTITHTAAM